MSNVAKLVLEAAGTRKALAESLHVSEQAVGQWFKKNTFPVRRVLQIEQITGVSRHLLRPDIYPLEGTKNETRKARPTGGHPEN